jgi:hypothetical protein
MICDRCHAPVVRLEASMSLVGRPILGGKGPRLVPTTLCPVCCSLLAMWLAEPVAELACAEPGRTP